MMPPSLETVAAIHPLATAHSAARRAGCPHMPRATTSRCRAASTSADPAIATVAGSQTVVAVIFTNEVDLRATSAPVTIVAMAIPIAARASIRRPEAITANTPNAGTSVHDAPNELPKAGADARKATKARTSTEMTSKRRRSRARSVRIAGAARIAFAARRAAPARRDHAECREAEDGGPDQPKARQRAPGSQRRRKAGVEVERRRARVVGRDEPRGPAFHLGRDCNPFQA